MLWNFKSGTLKKGVIQLVKVITRKGTYMLNRDEFQRYMFNLWKSAQAKKQAREDIKNDKKGNDTN